MPSPPQQQRPRRRQSAAKSAAWSPDGAGRTCAHHRRLRRLQPGAGSEHLCRRRAALAASAAPAPAPHRHRAVRSRDQTAPIESERQGVNPNRAFCFASKAAALSPRRYAVDRSDSNSSRSPCAGPTNELSPSREAESSRDGDAAVVRLWTDHPHLSSIAAEGAAGASQPVDGH